MNRALFEGVGARQRQASSVDTSSPAVSTSREQKAISEKPDLDIDVLLDGILKGAFYERLAEGFKTYS